MTKDEAIALANTRWWENADPSQVAIFQINEPLLCCPFGVFHEAVEKHLGRPVWTHEFASDGLKSEIMRDREAPTMAQILDLIPKEKRVILLTPDAEEPEVG
jgi:hypothetical protein